MHAGVHVWSLGVAGGLDGLLRIIHNFSEVLSDWCLVEHGGCWWLVVSVEESGGGWWVGWFDLEQAEIQSNEVSQKGFLVKKRGGGRPPFIDKGTPKKSKWGLKMGAKPWAD